VAVQRMIGGLSRIGDERDIASRTDTWCSLKGSPNRRDVRLPTAGPTVKPKSRRARPW